MPLTGGMLEISCAEARHNVGTTDHTDSTDGITFGGQGRASLEEYPCRSVLSAVKKYGATLAAPPQSAWLGSKAAPKYMRPVVSNRTADTSSGCANEDPIAKGTTGAADFPVGDEVADLFEGCRQYLELIAGAELGDDLRAKAGASDLVQEAFLEARNNIHRFHGTSRDELVAWLRKILLHRLSRLYGRYRGTDKRNVARECRPRHSSLNRLERFFDSEQTSPSGHAVRIEKIEIVRRAIHRLPAASRKVVTLRYRDRLKFCEIAAKVGRSPDAVRMLWRRAIERLACELERYHE